MNYNKAVRASISYENPCDTPFTDDLFSISSENAVAVLRAMNAAMDIFTQESADDDLFVHIINGHYETVIAYRYHYDGKREWWEKEVLKEKEPIEIVEV